MTIRIYYNDTRKKIMSYLLDTEIELCLLVLGIALGKEDPKSKLGPDKPRVSIEGYCDEKLYKTVKDFEELLDKVYSK